MQTKKLLSYSLLVAAVIASGALNAQAAVNSKPTRDLQWQLEDYTMLREAFGSDFTNKLRPHSKFRNGLEFYDWQLDNYTLTLENFPRKVTTGNRQKAKTSNSSDLYRRQMNEYPRTLEDFTPARKPVRK